MGEKTTVELKDCFSGVERIHSYTGDLVMVTCAQNASGSDGEPGYAVQGALLASGMPETCIVRSLAQSLAVTLVDLAGGSPYKTADLASDYCAELTGAVAAEIAGREKKRTQKKEPGVTALDGAQAKEFLRDLLKGLGE